MMTSSSTQIVTAPPGTGTATLGKTLPGLLWEASEKYDNDTFLNDRRDGEWRSLSIEQFKVRASELAVGLRQLGLSRGDRVALYMESDVDFCIADMGCLLAGLVDVPVYLTHTPEAIEFVLRHADVHAVLVSDASRLAELVPTLARLDTLTDVVVFDANIDNVPGLNNVAVRTAEYVMDSGRTILADNPKIIDELRDQISPDDTATIIYTSGTTGQPKGVVLTHENISFNGLTSFSGIPEYNKRSGRETAISFLPMTHVFARTLHYGFVYHATSVYFISTDEISGGMKEIRPTVFATVPRVLEKVYAAILQKGVELSGLKRKIFETALSAARDYELGHEPSPLLSARLKVADKLVFSKWREATGGRVEWIICGGASLSAEIANIFAAAGIHILQGYGLTETSPVITFNRPDRNRAGTVGEPIPGVEVMIAEDGEILTRGPHIMVEYYRNEEKTKQVIDEDGWFHTGDIGEFTDEGFLRITDRKKDLFKLSTGKYVMPQPLENGLTSHPMIDQAVVFGPSYKFCTALIFPSVSVTRSFAATQGLDEDMTDDELFHHPVILDKFGSLIDNANEGMEHWSTIKKFRIVHDELTPESGLLTPSLKVKRPLIHEKYKQTIESMYTEDAVGYAV